MCVVACGGGELRGYNTQNKCLRPGGVFTNNMWTTLDTLCENHIHNIFHYGLEICYIVNTSSQHNYL